MTNQKAQMVLDLFDGKTNTTTQTGSGQDLSGEMKTYYSDYLIDLAEPELVHDQFGQKHPIPRNGGKTIEFRKYDSLPKMLTALTEGVTPDGQKLSMSTITATVAQYGGYVEMSDMLLLTAIDNNLVQATRQLASQAGRTLDTITRRGPERRHQRAVRRGPGDEPGRPLRRLDHGREQPPPDRGRGAQGGAVPQGDERAPDQRLLRGHHPPGRIL